jgi:nifR3 family TIM-barrel protein
MSATGAPTIEPAAPAAPGLRIGPLEVSPPVVLAPMAGITNTAFRRVCRRFGGGLFVSEMITARGLVEGSNKTWGRAAFAPDESPRSIQLYGSDPVSMGEAVRRLTTGGHVDHVDLNLGCPVRKITRHGGGAALTARPRLLAAILDAAVTNAGPVPVTAKFRIGIDDDVTTFLDAGRIAEEAGCAAVALHARTAAQLYSGVADWSAIAELKAAVRTIPVLGNGDIWCGADAVRMLAETGCDGVVIGRGCLGRPWLFRDLADALAGRPLADPPPLGEVLDTMAWHVSLLADHLGESRALVDFRKHVPWYLTGYPVGSAVRKRVHDTTTLAQFDAVLAELDRAIVPLPGAVDLPRGTHRGPQSVTLPDRWLADRDCAEPPSRLADARTSGG